MVNDPIGDMIARIRNAAMRKRSKVNTPASRMRERVLGVLQSEGYIRGFTLVQKPGVARSSRRRAVRPRPSSRRPSAPSSPRSSLEPFAAPSRGAAIAVAPLVFWKEAAEERASLRVLSGPLLTSCCAKVSKYAQKIVIDLRAGRLHSVKVGALSIVGRL